MPSYIITAPDGQKYRVSGDGTQDEALAHFQSQYAAPTESPEDARQKRIAAIKASDPSEYDPKSPEYQAKYGATSAMSGTDKFMAGAGKSVVDIGRGLRQIGAGAADLFTAGSPRSDALRTQQDENARLDAPLMNTGAGMAGNVAGTLATTLLPGTLAARGAGAVRPGAPAAAGRALVNPTTYKAAAATGAAIGALQPVGTEDSRLLNTAIGAGTGVVGQAATGVLGRIAQPLTNRLSKTDQKAVDVLKNSGVSLDAAQRSGSKGAELLKRAVSDNPFTAGGQQQFAEAQRAQFTKAVLKTIGEDADAATADVMGNARDRIGGVMDAVADRTPVQYSGKLNHDLAMLSAQAHKELVPQDYAVIANQIDDIFTKAKEGGGAIDGKAYQNLRSSLQRVSEGGKALGHWGGKLRETIEDALEQSASPEDLKSLREARRQYRRMKQIEGAIDTEGSGSISPSKLANSLGTIKNRSSSVYGKGDRQLVMLAQAGKRLLPDKFPNSGTTARMLAQTIAPAAIGIGTGIGSGDTKKGLAAGAGAAGLLLGARGAVNNQRVARAKLAEGVSPDLIRNMLMAPRKIGAAGAAAALPALQE